MRRVKKNEEKKDNNYFVFGCLLGIAICCIIFSIMNYYTHNKLKSDVNVSAVSSSITEDWDSNVKIVVDVEEELSGATYSFDGGLTWQDSNEFVATKNGNFEIIVKDNNGLKSSIYEYEVSSIDNVPPVITVTLPKQVIIGSVLDLNNYVSVTDDLSGVDGDVKIEPLTLDTSSLGQKKIVFSAIDKAQNIVTIETFIEIVSENEQKNDNNTNTEEEYITQYRYRTRKTNTYECGVHDCSYYDDNNLGEKIVEYVDTGKCDASLNGLITFKNGCYITPSNADVICTQSIITKERYSLINGLYVDIYALTSDGLQYSRYKNSDSDKAYDYNENTAKEKTQLEANTLNSNFKSAPCGENEVDLYGYCHPVCSKPTYKCSNGYELIDGVCKKYVSKTCSDTCVDYTWSEWSAWSDVVISATDNIQVETKRVKK